MMTDVFLLQLMMTFLVGSAWLYLTLLSGTHFGTKVGGFIGGLPSTVLLAFFFIAFTQSPEVASKATTVFPLAIAISGLFLVVYAWLVRRGFLLAVSASPGTWFVLSCMIALFHPAMFTLNLAIYAVAMVFAYRVLDRRLLVTSIADSKTVPSGQHMLIRSLCGGCAIMLTVLIARIGGPVLGGIFTGFPAMFIATLTITYRVHGVEFSRAMTKPLMVTGVITVALYSFAVRYFYISTGLYIGTLISICISGVSAYLTYRYVLPKLA